jgi:hypothetical protein
MTQALVRATRRRGLSPGGAIVGIVVAAGGVLLVVVCMGVALAKLGSTTTAEPAARFSTAAPAPVTTVTQFDRAAFDAWWGQWAQTSWGTTVVGIDRDGYGMTARTELFPDADARQPALSICGAVLTYFSSESNPPAVRVLDQAGNILASRRTGESACTYRR